MPMLCEGSYAGALCGQLAPHGRCYFPLQVFANAFLFNPRESNVGVMATTLQVGVRPCTAW